MPNLVELNLAKNNIVSIEKATGLKNLVRLDVSENQIMEIPEKVGILEDFFKLKLKKIGQRAWEIGNFQFQK